MRTVPLQEVLNRGFLAPLPWPNPESKAALTRLLAELGYDQPDQSKQAVINVEALWEVLAEHALSMAEHADERLSRYAGSLAWLAGVLEGAVFDIQLKEAASAPVDSRGGARP